MAIVVPTGNPGAVSGLADFANPDLLIGLCSDRVPCGDLAREVLGKAGVVPALDTSEPDVRALLGKVAAGELDAGIVYATDVAAAGAEVESIAIPEEMNVEAAYPIAVLTEAPNPSGAGAFLAYVLSTPGQDILKRYGFLAP
jgi:molybdate transport system substrate-binding protein